MKTKTTADWKEIAKQTYKTKNEVRTLMRLNNGRVPVALLDQILKVLDELDRYETKAEDAMFDSGIMDHHIFEEKVENMVPIIDDEIAEAYEQKRLKRRFGRR